jgi:hypothetical protein
MFGEEEMDLVALREFVAEVVRVNLRARSVAGKEIV